MNQADTADRTPRLQATARLERTLAFGLERALAFGLERALAFGGLERALA